MGGVTGGDGVRRAGGGVDLQPAEAGYTVGGNNRGGARREALRGQRDADGVGRTGVPGGDRVAELVFHGHAQRHRAAGGDRAGRLGGDHQLVLGRRVDRDGGADRRRHTGVGGVTGGDGVRRAGGGVDLQPAEAGYTVGRNNRGGARREALRGQRDADGVGR